MTRPYHLTQEQSIALAENMNLVSLDMLVSRYIEVDDLEKLINVALDKVLGEQWISVKDKLPEKKGNYLAVFYEWVGRASMKPNQPEVAVKWFNEFWHKQHYTYDTGGYENLEVTHWMPLPNAPKGLT
jgi:hypothetical protein